MARIDREDSYSQTCLELRLSSLMAASFIIKRYLVYLLFSIRKIAAITGVSAGCSRKEKCIAYSFKITTMQIYILFQQKTELYEGNFFLHFLFRFPFLHFFSRRGVGGKQEKEKEAILTSPSGSRLGNTTQTK